MASQKFVEISKSFFVDADYKSALTESGLTSIDAVFAFSGGENLAKDNLADYRSRLKFEINSPPAILFLKRYNHPPVGVQLKNWLNCRGIASMSFANLEPAKKLAAAGINTPKLIADGEQWGPLFEKRSFIITEKITGAESLERKLPDCFTAPPWPENLKLRRNFISQLAAFVKKFHQTGYRHRDLYLCHIFYDDNGRFYLIDLARTFKPIIFRRRFQIKDIAQIHYSAPKKYISRTDRLRFYLAYTGHRRLTRNDKSFIDSVMRKAGRMARHDTRHGRAAPYEN